MIDIAFSWSGGKDSALALHRLRRNDDVRIRCLLTTVTEDFDRISMHGVRRSLLEAQAEAIGLPLEIVRIPAQASNDVYESRMRTSIDRLVEAGVGGFAFGDIYLTDVRRYREEKLTPKGLTSLFPIWGDDTRRLMREFMGVGFRAVVSCVDTTALDGSFSGRELDERFVADLPEGADPCGENGEYHSFVFDGPLFSKEVRWAPGERTLRDNRFLYTDLLPAGSKTPSAAP